MEEQFKTLEAFVLMRLINAQENNITVDANKARESETALSEVRVKFKQLKVALRRIEQIIKLSYAMNSNYAKCVADIKKEVAEGLQI